MFTWLGLNFTTLLVYSLSCLPICSEVVSSDSFLDMRAAAFPFLLSGTEYKIGVTASHPPFYHCRLTLVLGKDRNELVMRLFSKKVRRESDFSY